jgi:hypothetical protein
MTHFLDSIQGSSMLPPPVAYRVNAGSILFADQLGLIKFKNKMVKIINFGKTKTKHSSRVTK